MSRLFPLALVLALVLITNIIPASAQDQEFVVVVNKETQGSSINMAALKGIYLREMRRWGNGGAITPVDLSADPDVRGVFYKTLFGKTPDQMRAYWLNQQIKNNVLPPVVEKDSDSARKFVASNKGAIAFLKAGSVDDSVKVLKVVN